MSTLLGLALLATLSMGAARAADGAGPAAPVANPANEVCASCHEEPAKKIPGTAHASVACATCHVKHEEYPHPAGVRKPACATCHQQIAGEHARSVHGQELKKGNAGAPGCDTCHGAAHEVKNAATAEFHKGVPETCGMCHSDIADQFKGSVHGAAIAAGNPSAPVCTSCHGEHQILAARNEASTVNKGHIRETCAQCHADVRLAKRFGMPADRIVTFDESFHGLAAKSGQQSVANCASCHGFHAILPSKNAKATTNPKNLPQTCGQCHPGAGTRFALGPVHQAAGGTSEPEPVKWVRVVYTLLIPLTIGLMLMHNLGDWVRKLFQRRFGRGAASAPSGYVSPAHKREMRMYAFERVQHAVLAISFLTLVWTGFALKYPDHLWAWPLLAWEKSFPVRGTVHRIAAVMMIAGAVMHVVSLICSRRLRNHWMSMLPRRRDLPEAVANFAYNLGIISRKPRISAHSYIEKAEYWAVVWGTLVMAATGIVLWANNLALAWMPKIVSDIATSVHFYEAVLATLAIVVWHFYSVILDPDVYPVDTSWLTGYSVREHEPEESHNADTPSEDTVEEMVEVVQDGKHEPPSKRDS